MAKHLRVLIVEDAEDDCQLILRELRRGGFLPDHLRVQTAEQLQAALAADGWDIVLSDFSMPGYSGLAVIRTLQDSGLDLPCIIVSGAIGEDAAVTAIRDGAHDYVMKDRLARLPLAVEQQLAEAAARRERRRMEEQVRRSNAELAGLQAIAVAVSRSLDLKKVLEAALEETIRVLGAEAGAVFLAEPAEDGRQPAAQRGFPEQALPDIAELAAEAQLLANPEGARLVRLGDDPRPACCRLSALGWAELVAVALQARQGGLGILLVGSRRKGAFSAAALSLAAGIGSQISVAAENARLHEQVQARTRYLEILQLINERLRSTLPLRKVLDIIAEGATRAVEGIAAVILVHDPAQACLRVGAFYGSVLLNAALKLTGRAVDSYYIPSAGKHPAAVAYREGRLQEWSGGLRALTVDLQPAVPERALPLVEAAIGARCGACLPLPAGDKTVGVLVHFSRRPQLSAQERLMLTGLADQGGLAVESARLFEETQRLRSFNESIVQGVAEAIFIQDERGAVTFMNPAAVSLLGTGIAGLQGRQWEQLPGPPQAAQEAGASPPVRRYETELRDRQGRPVPVIVSSRPLQLDGRAAGILSACTDISERVRTERLLQALNRAALAMARALTHEEIFAAAAGECATLGCPCLLLLHDPQRQALRVRHFSYGEQELALFRRITGVLPSELELPVAKVAGEWERLTRRETVVVQNGARMLEALMPVLSAAQAAELARALSLETCIAAPLVTDEGVMGVFAVASLTLRDRDVPAIAALANQIAAAWHKNALLQELRENLQELRKVQGQLVHAQKMEAVGRLAGGVAHDFNNQLTVILGNAEMLLEKTRGHEQMRQEIEEILNTAQRSAQLTQQLLAFSRKQFSRPVSLDPRELLHNMERMLRRLIGEDVELEFRLAANTGWIHADPGQLEQVLMNLAVNARDAMPQGGRLLISSTNSTLEQMSLLGQGELPPGRYVVLAVSDNGTGMEPQALEHLFEPFFTTKPAGVGTGLGLAIVYGIVRQSGGAITVESEWGRGTTFSIYLPCIEPPQPSSPVQQQGQVSRGRGETILLVEDEAPLGRLLGQSLEANGYRVLSAASSDEALRVAGVSRQPIQLLLSDVIMPGSLPRKEMIERLEALQPGLRVILMSGYTDEAITRQGVLQPGRRFLAKPFSLVSLLENVRSALDEPLG